MNYSYLKPKSGLKPAVKSGLKPANKSGLRPAKKPMGAQPGLGAFTPSARGMGQPAASAPQPVVAPLSDSRYTAEESGLNRNFADTNLAINNREYAIREQGGFDPEFASNPYTRANALMRAATQRFNSTTNSAARSGQLYSGATSRARDADVFTGGLERDTAQRDYNQQLSQINADRLGAQRERDEGLSSSYLDMIDRASSQEPDAALYPEDEGSYLDGGGKPKNKKGQKKPQIKTKPGLGPAKKTPDKGYFKPVTPAAQKKGKKK